MSIEYTTRSGPCRRSGFTLIEALGVTTLTALLSVALLGVFSSTGDAFTEMNVDAQVDTIVLRTLDRLEDEFRFAVKSSVQVPNTQSVSFTTSEGWDGTAAIESTPRWLIADSGRLLIQNLVLVENLTFFEAVLVENLLTITLEVSVPYTRDGGSDTINRRFVWQHRLES